MELYKYTICKGSRGGIAIADNKDSAVRNISEAYKNIFEPELPDSEISAWRLSDSVTFAVSNCVYETYRDDERKGE